MPVVELKPVDNTNREHCLSLRVSEDQSHSVASNEVSLAQAEHNPHNTPLVVYWEGEPVGFVMYEARSLRIVSIHRFMIDSRYQRRGIGTAAMQALLQSLRGEGYDCFYLSFKPDNLAALRLYSSLGFVEEEVEPDGEIVYRLGPRRAL